jgi:3-oxoacyl-[acyl-carrier-protein] synthase II
MRPQRVFITGLGVVAPGSVGAEALFQTLTTGRSQTRTVTPTDLGWPVLRGLDRTEPLVAAPAPDLPQRPGDNRLVTLARTAVVEALGTLGPPDDSLCDWGLVLGASKGDLWRPDAGYGAGPGDVAERIGRELGFGAGWLAPVAACATGLVAIGTAYQRLRCGDWTCAVAGGVDSSFHPGLMASYRRLGVLSRERDRPETACRPFDESRSGFVVGEGAGVVRLEQDSPDPLAEILGYALTSDAAGPLQLPTGPASLAQAITLALEQARLTTADVDLISLHGTGTQANDALEAAALRMVFGDRLDAIPAWSCKGALGHLLGAGGAVELIALVQALRSGLVPPTVNLRNPAPDCRLGHVRDVAQAGTFRVGLKLSLGFGGHCAALILRA